MMLSDLSSGCLVFCWVVVVSFGDGRKLIDWGIDFTEVDFNSVTCDKASSPARASWAPTIVHVSRPEEVESKRKDLRVAMKEYDMMEAVNQKTCDYTCWNGYGLWQDYSSSTGGTIKSLHFNCWILRLVSNNLIYLFVWQFLYEAGLGSNKDVTRSGMIGVSLSHSKEGSFWTWSSSQQCGWVSSSARKGIGENCAAKFMTDGILLQEFQVWVYIPPWFFERTYEDGEITS